MLKRPNRSICAETQPPWELCSRGQIVSTSSHTRGVTGQTVNYFCPFVKGARFIIQKVLFDIEAKPILLQCLEISRFIADHIPILVTASRPSHREVHRTKALV